MLSEFKEKPNEKATKTKKPYKNVLFIICVILFLVLLGILSGNGNLHVISIGVPSYKNHWNMDIPQNQDDAERIHKILQQSKSLFSNISREIIATHGEATKGNIEKAIKKIYKKARGNDVVLIYISSHGEKYENGEYLLFPYDFDKKSKYETSFSVKNLIKKSNIKTIVWIDACESGAAAKNLINNNVDLLVSSSEDECSISTRNGSVFTNTLLKGLDCEADYNEDGIVTLREITSYVVRSHEKNLNPIQKIPDLKLVECR
jgi:hypothetical protein